MKTKTLKRTEAYDRQTARNRRSAAQQLALLDKRPGQSRRERNRLS